MNFGCQSMTGKIESILLKKPEQAFISQEHLEKTWEEFKYFGCPSPRTRPPNPTTRPRSSAIGIITRFLNLS